MKKEFLKIKNIPSILWGENTEKVIIAVHGNMSNKEDIPIKILAEKAVEKGYQILSFDLPQHGERKNDKTLCKVQECEKELREIMEFTMTKWKDISFFGNSIGAYFGLIAYKNIKLSKALFLSPVTDMKRIIENMMSWFGVTKEQLKIKKIIPTPIGQNLYWDYYQFVKENPIKKWETPTYILYGEKDELCEKEFILKFVENFNCNLKISKDSEHWFHTEKDLSELEKWFNEVI